MNLDDATKLFAAGGLVAARLEVYREICSTERRYALVLTTAAGDEVPLRMARQNETRLYKTVQAGLNDIERIGFKIEKLLIVQD